MKEHHFQESSSGKRNQAHTIMRPDRPYIPEFMQSKIQKLIQILQDEAPLLIAYSGGVDSALLAALALEYAGPGAVQCILIDGPAFSRRAFHEGVKISEELSLPLTIIREELLSEPVMKENPSDRCRICKRAFCAILTTKSREYHCKSIADGANASDLTEYRPGIDEMTACGVIHPFIMAGITKQDIRTISQKRGYSFWNKPSSACLFSRIPYGEEITWEKLRMIEEGEAVLENIGILQGRVRHHDTIARIEVLPVDMDQILSHKEMILKKFQEIGFRYITLDLQGYRPGSMDEILPIHKKTRT